MNGSTGLSVKKFDGRWAVSDGTQRVSGIFNTFDEAEARLEKMVIKARRKQRPCITCRRAFMSEGAHHRMCTDCRLLSEPQTHV